MKSSTFISLLAGPLAAQAHYIFSIVFVNGVQKGGDYTYIRKNSNTYMPSYTNDIINSPDLRCNQGAVAGSTQTLTVKAGDKIGFKIWFNEKIEHPGPGFVYMSKAPDLVSNYDGSGNWFKAAEMGLCGGRANEDTAWCTWQKDRIEFTIPQRTPPGEYLVRVEHLAIHESHAGKGQFYMECAQFKVEGSGGGTPGPLVKIPGLYKATDPGIAYNKWTNNPANYVMPGPAVWTDNGSNAAAASPDSSASNDTSKASSSESSTEPSSSSQPSSKPSTPAASNGNGGGGGGGGGGGSGGSGGGNSGGGSGGGSGGSGNSGGSGSSGGGSGSGNSGGGSGGGGGGGSGAALFAQCGGQGFNGPTTCAKGTCKVINQWYSQCA
ncbi:hypothetical protein PpBr36_02027 [Pyricularia pennisetigena]|uniref:hypothetical protein n=1 Tax=Pyricularia pennisetigena TaxID=1578925 RepID=UPI00114FBE07|nr:hypothetical protein PpBr36_02027 [Pyricularia pennisetigena]TLS28025.1 hypothetical protein PpBr36_02027 [Pyricularia pennisetigena]